MRIYLGGDVRLVETLAAGQRVMRQGVVAASEDELDEDDAMHEAAEGHSCVVVAEVANTNDGFELDDVASFHLDADGTGSLAWYATQEVDAVIEVLRNAAG